MTGAAGPGRERPAGVGTRAHDPWAALSEPAWWDGERPLLETLREMVDAVRTASREALRLLPGDADGQAEAEQRAAGEAQAAPAAEVPAGATASGSAPVAPVAPPEPPPSLPPRARPLMLPGLAEAMGVDPAGAVTRGRRRR